MWKRSPGRLYICTLYDQSGTHPRGKINNRGRDAHQDPVTHIEQSNNQSHQKITIKSDMTIHEVSVGLVVSIDINFEDPRDGYFLKTVYQKHQAYDPLRESEDFILTQPAEDFILTASSGPYTVQQKIPPKLADNVMNTQTKGKQSFTHHDVVFNHDVTAHIVTEQVTKKWPKLQILFHASPNSDFKFSKKRKSKSRTLVASDRISASSMCGHMFLNNNNQELSSICVLNVKDSACITSIILPSEWWHENSTVKVSYAFSLSENNQECASASNSIVPGRSFENPLTSRKRQIANLPLSPVGERYTEEKVEGILVQVPIEPFSPGAIFEIPVKLKENSYVQNFVMSARVRQGLKITGAIAKADGPWQIHVDIRDRMNVATVTAFLKDPALASGTNGLQDVFKWQMQVEDNVTDIESSRVVWSLKYERDSHKEIYLPSQSRLVARINIRGRESEKLVTVLKTTEILNMAMLTGKRQTYQLKLYKVSESDDLVYVTKDAACHSAETDVLKVTRDCSIVYVDGTERRGSHNVTIITKSGRHTAFTYIKVWIPMDPVDIQLSDAKLSQIRSWKVSSFKPKSKGRSRNRRMVVDFGMLTHPSVYLSKKGKKHMRGHCKLRYQQSLLDVYIKFYIETPTGREYYKGRQASLKVTNILKNQLRVSDPRIVSLKGKVLQGLSQGRTEIQVLSPNGRVMAAREVRVGGDKVTVERLIITLVSGVTMEIQTSNSISGALTAVAHVQSKLQSRYKDAVLDIVIQFSDDTKFPLKYVTYSDYFLEVSPINQHIIGLASYSEGRPYEPKIVAMNEGRGECLRVVLKVGDMCLKKRSVDLALDHVFVESDFSLANEVNSGTYLRDDSYGNNRASDRHDNYGIVKKIPFELSNGHKAKLNLNNEDDITNEKFGKSKKNSKESQVIPFPSDLAKKLPQESPQTKKEPLKAPAEQNGLTPLEIGMYVLLAVFCVAISVFLVNCIVFMVRYKRKHKPRKKHKEPVYQANDWVWIGKATLERNAINTQCSQSLMPAEDFNGNHTPPPTSRGNSSSSSAQNSNRNSFVSTIKGSECSIRITANPLPEDDGAGNHQPKAQDSASTHSSEPKWDYEAMGLTYDQLADYFDNLKESSA
ncbi:hypothetical protein FSP39_016486 [Pinctada imbricata]|uniref:Transmembrane protein 132E n=1 Tax=Pinctada imbricata TaxID=66713 RepID=A0AA88XFZ7_PINIB|nr:hypothetical protein FSP39_016486 [Pinctada imbricata]